LRRQAASGETAGADHHGGLDPFALPARIALPQQGKPPEAATTAAIDRDRVVLRGALGSRSLPISSFRGIAVRIEANEQGITGVVLELHHSDPALSVPITATANPEDIAADWQAWSKALALPMLLIEADGSVSEPFGEPGGVKAETPKPRRLHSYFANRRPRFLARRKPGWRRAMSRADGAEIIARD